MRRSVKLYFEHHVQDYASRHADFYKDLSHFVKIETGSKKRPKILDIGCGDGGFVRALVDASINGEYFLIDLSSEMVRLAKQNLIDFDIKIFVADILSLPLRKELEFDLIHIDSVLHHLIDNTQSKSNSLVNETIKLLTQRLKSDGTLIIDEWYFSSIIVSSFASFLIFYGLKLINYLRLDLSFIGEIRPGLEVNFLEPKKFLRILTKYGYPELLFRKAVNFPMVYRLFLLREKGRITYILRKNIRARI